MGSSRSNAVGVYSVVQEHFNAPLVDSRSAKITLARRPATNAAISHECTALNAYRFAELVGSGIVNHATVLATYLAHQRPCRLRSKKCREKFKRERPK
jgi:hypothetical protein